MEGARKPHLLLDQGLPRDAAGLLRSAGMRCTHVGEVGMSTAADLEILEWARHQQSIVVTLDADFHAMLVVQRASKPSVVRLRLQGQDGQAIAGLLPRIVEKYFRGVGRRVHDHR